MPSPPLSPVTLSCNTDPRLIDLIQVVGAELLKHMSFSLEDAEQLWLAIQEGIANAMRHGNGLDPAKPLTVTFTPSRESLSVRIEDCGSGFDPAQVPDPNLPENILKPSGRGVYFMRQVMDSVVVETTPAGTALTLVKHRTSTSADTGDE
nr:ATP-binding protein [uncultured Holophaga sp.]